MKTRVPAPFGVLLKRYRMAAMLTQEQLAIHATLSPDTIRALESGKRRAPRAATLQLIVAALALTGAERAAMLAAATPAQSVPPADSAPSTGAPSYGAP